MPVKPRLAASVILLRESIPNSKFGDYCEFEVFMAKRHGKARFMSNHHVFPGGAIDKQDITKDSKERLFGFDNSIIHLLKEVYEDPSILWIVAIRELFEETGILIARDEEGNLLEKKARKLMKYQRTIQKKRKTMTEILISEKLYYNVSNLKYFGRFITPEASPIRFDTQFFICEFPHNQIINLFYDELTEGVWASPEQFIKKFKKGEIKLIFPQYLTLKRLRKFRTIEEVIENSKNISSHNRLK